MSNSDQLAGARAKIKRAKHHVRELHTAAEAYRKRNPNLIVGEIDWRTGAQIFKVKIVEPIPLDWSMMIGDCVHNLRTAFDYVIHEAILVNGEETSRVTGFPIGRTRDAFETSLERKNTGIQPQNPSTRSQAQTI